MEEALTIVLSLEKPTDFLNPSQKLKDKCVSLLPNLFSVTAGSSNKCDIPIENLHTEGFNIEDIWQQIELINEPLLNQAKGLNLDQLIRTDPISLLQIEEKNDLDNSPDKELDNERDSEIESGLEEDILESEDNGNEFEDQQYEESELFEDSTEAGKIAEDQFFNLSEMESFVEQAEREAMGEGKGKHKEDSDEDSIDLFDSGAGEDFELDSEDSLEGSEADTAGKDQYFYGDFFDPVNQATPTDIVPVDTPLSAHQKRQEKISDHIARLEAKNLEHKSWQMGGEASSRMREANSLLQEDLAYDHVTCPAPDITEEVTFALEDIIKQRVLDKAWDDVIRKEKPKEKPFNYHLNQRLDQEKSKMSLAEVYEQEYLKQVEGEKQDQENPRHEEIRKMMSKLFAELDALANFHFTPQVPDPVIKTIPNLPSVAMEEVAPVTHSNAMLLAPEELHIKSRKTDIGVSEKTATDKKRERRHKKVFQHFYKAKTVGKKEKHLKNTGKLDAIKSSDKFFERLSEKVEGHIKERKKVRFEDTAGKDTKLKLRHLKL